MTIEALLELALRLSTEDRTELVARLLDSLRDAARDPGHAAAWTDDLWDGRVELIDGRITMARAGDAVAAAAARRR